jgi:two-component system CheB/CheR fusion protein
MRIRPYLTLTSIIDGVVITFSDITSLKRAEAEREGLLKAIQHARLFAEQIVETVREPLLVLDANLRVQSANRAFYQTFHTTPAETEQTLLYDLGDGQWDSPQLRTLLSVILSQNTAFEDFEMTHTFLQIGRKTMLLNARQIRQMPDQASLILLAIADVTDRKQAAMAVQQAHDVLETRVRERTHELAEVNAALLAEIGERTRTEQARQQLLQQLVTAQEEERRRIARELHDQMGQDITVLLLDLKALRDTDSGDSAVRDRVEQLQMLAMQIGQHVRTLALQLRPTALDDLGLAVTLANYVEQWSAHALVAVDFQSLGLEGARLPLSVEAALYRLVQEALNNVLKHARATGVSLIVERRASDVHMIVEDDGVGFDVEAALHSAPTKRRLGLVGMHERVAQLGGTLAIEAAPGSGTSVFVRIPLADARHGGTDDGTTDLPG